jgi:peptide deformylase
MKSGRIVLFGDPALRVKAMPVTAFHKKLHRTIDAMRTVLSSRDDGAALAATQVAIPRRIVVIDYLDEYLEMLNPEITASSGESEDFEGCLSLPGFSGRVKRAESVTVSFRDRDGNPRTIARDGRMARCIQHEIDHLDGILFIDRMEDEFVFNVETKTRLVVKDLIKATMQGGEQDRQGATSGTG